MNRPGINDAQRLALEHVYRCWDAESTNADRLAARVRMMVPLGTSILGLVAVGFIGSLIRAAELVHWGWLIAPGVVALLSIAALVKTLLVLVTRSNAAPEVDDSVQDNLDRDVGDERVTASALLELPSRYALQLFGDKAGDQLDDAAQLFIRTHAAAMDLRARNSKIRTRGRKAEVWIARSMVLVAAADIIYGVCLLAGVRYAQTARATENISGSHSTRTGSEFRNRDAHPGGGDHAATQTTGGTDHRSQPAVQTSSLKRQTRELTPLP